MLFFYYKMRHAMSEIKHIKYLLKMLITENGLSVDSVIDTRSN